MNCPKCQRPLASCGEVLADGQRLLVYQCDECLVPWELEGEQFDTALTFAVDAAGQYLDPESLAPLSLN